MAGGTSPNALANINQGVQPAMAQYQSAIKDIRKDDREAVKGLIELGLTKEKFMQEVQKMGIDVDKAQKVYDATIEAAKINAASRVSAAGAGSKLPTTGSIMDAQIQNGILIDNLTEKAKTQPLSEKEQAQLNTARSSNNKYMEILAQQRPVQPNAAIPNAVTARLKDDREYNNLDIAYMRARNDPTLQAEIKKKMDARVLQIEKEVAAGASGGRGIGGTDGASGTGGTSDAGATGNTQPLPMPKTQGELKINGVYNTTRGPAKWDGKQFIPVK